MFITIEIACSEHVSSTERGRLLEKLGYEVLESMQYSVTDQVRLTGMEVDLIAKHKISSEEVYVECKAQRDNISADVITKLLGNVAFKGVSSGWLITTAMYGKDAKGLALEWDKKPPEEKRKLHLYSPDRLVELLVSSGKVCNPESLNNLGTHTNSGQIYLLITDHGRFWATTVADVNAGVNHSVRLFDAQSGDPIYDNQIIQLVSQTDSSLKDLKWLSSDSDGFSEVLQRLNKEVQSIVKVPSSDHWADYRPSRPEDFVGRKQIQSEFFSFLDGIREKKVKTRILAIKSPSGWGKSSILLKLISRCENQHNRHKYYMYAVDCRAAVSRRFGELAIVACLKGAIASNFICAPKESLKLGGTSNPLSDSTLIPALDQLKREGKVIVLFFDQFEEIFAKQELAALFNDINLLCSAIDSAQENIVIGFSWKTDGTIPQDHPAYHMWQGLADRRKEFPLAPFNTTEVSSALTLFSKELKQPLNPQLKRILTEHCQGYPWLLKKLLIHVYFKLMRDGMEQSDILGQALNVSELFRRELAELPPNELACIKKIANESPAEFFQIEDVFGGETIKSLFNKRLVLRSGSRLTLYWDIFRDYVLSEKVPHIPVSYIPQSDIQRYTDVLRILLKEGRSTVSLIVTALGIGEGRVDNIVRDLVMIGNAESIRKNGTLIALQSSENDAVLTILKFWKSHVIFNHLLNSKGSGFSTTQDEIKSLLKHLYPGAKFAGKTWDVYSRRIIRWLSSIGLTVMDGAQIRHMGESLSKEFMPLLGKPSRRGRGQFLGAAPPERVLLALDLILAGRHLKSELLRVGHRNSLYVLDELGLIELGDDQVILTEAPSHDKVAWLRGKAANSKTVKFVVEILKEGRKIAAKDVGDAIAQKFDFTLSASSKLRYGSALSRWAKWTMHDTRDLF